ncbi:hypothetical protein NKJ88_05935 [Mesorhizobium sp. M0016]|uniref:hypothetical protein n=1 Tax=Mesorhizobium sp. M0016 TaxID=2956843 RepID=UPI00333737EA
MLIALLGKYKNRAGQVVIVTSLDDAPASRPNEPIRGNVDGVMYQTCWRIDGTWSDDGRPYCSFDIVEKIER